MESTRSTRIIYWVTTGIIVLFEGVMPAFTGHTEFAKEGIRNLGYPDYFITLLVVYKVLGSLAILIPQVPGRVKEWAYSGLGFILISAVVSNWVVFGFGFEAILPFLFFLILCTSNIYYHKLTPALSAVKV